MELRHPDLRIRPGRADDAAAMVEILNPIVATRSYSVLDRPVDVDEQRGWVESLPTRSVLHVAVLPAPERLVGVQDLVPFAPGLGSQAHVGVVSTFVALEHHGQGIAARLFDATFEAAMDLGYEKLLAWVRADNDAGLRAYLGHGFLPVGTAERHARVDGAYVDAVLLERFL